MEDNQGPISIVKNPVAHSRTKHINICYHLQSCAEQMKVLSEGMVQVKYYKGTIKLGEAGPNPMGLNWLEH